MNSLRVTCIIPGKTPSVNALYRTFTKKSKKGKIMAFRALTKEAKEAKKKINPIVVKEPLPDEPLLARIEVYGNWYNKNNTIKRKDLAPLEKFIIDSIFEKLEVDDKQIFKIIMEKVQCDTEQVAVMITKMNAKVR